MDKIERLIKQMRKAGAYYNAPALQIGIVGTNKTIKIGDLELDAEDYLIDCNLRLDDTETRFYHTKKVPAETNLVSAHNDTLKEYREDVLKEGDQVVLVQMETKDKDGNDSELFVVLAKVVSVV